ncbi:MAG: ABC transporter permease [Bacteroidetes bacterium]|nr:ABC transporter permease [Bacteroidota bacterium]
MRELLFNLTLAFRAIRNNRLRSWLTIAIIGLGLMALIAILTSIEVLKAAVYSNFSSMGSNSFRISNAIIRQKGGGGMQRSRDQSKNISYDEAKAFKERFDFPSVVSISVVGTPIATVKFGSEKTNPNIRVLGIDNEYLQIADTKMEQGRTFSDYELYSGSYSCILGNSIAKKLFKKTENAVNKVISVGDVKYRVIGVAEAKGGSMMMNSDNIVYAPLSTVRTVYGGDKSYLLNVSVNSIALKTKASEEAEGLFRAIRKLPLGTANDFSISQNDSLVQNVLDLIGYIRAAALVIAIITLLGSVIGLMNIMLVSVAERTREIGVSKALGARSSTIKQQFLSESVIISLLGGTIGITLGIAAGNMVGLVFKTGFIMPWLWVAVGFSLCAVVGILSGIFPAIKASKLDPIVALRYE